jgi:lipid-A-disaccharide synthase-like uncharacterized protein
MQNDRFLNIYGWVLIGLFIGCLYTIYIVAKIDSKSILADYLGAIISVWYLATGVGTLFRKTWGYYFLKSFLYVLLLGFPIGTFIAVRSLRFMKINSTRKEFIT